MIPRSELIAALAEISAAKDEAQSKAREVASLEQQLLRIKEQRKSELAAFSELVPRSELEAAKEREEGLAALARDAAEKHRDIIAKLERKITVLEEETQKLRATIQVLMYKHHCFPCRRERCMKTTVISVQLVRKWSLAQSWRILGKSVVRNHT